ncbi:MAG: hypothetical protein SOW36_06165 [Porphyromonas sp.]|nr:hypothetical protein [uncultured Porphyromonas sp.]MDY3112202.1 hypothetical protein [Porphyromonas sp.]
MQWHLHAFTPLLYKGTAKSADALRLSAKRSAPMLYRPNMTNQLFIQ